MIDQAFKTLDFIQRFVNVGSTRTIVLLSPSIAANHLYYKLPHNTET